MRINSGLLVLVILELTFGFGCKNRDSESVIKDHNTPETVELEEKWLNSVRDDLIIAQEQNQDLKDTRSVLGEAFDYSERKDALLHHLDAISNLTSSLTGVLNRMNQKLRNPSAGRNTKIAKEVSGKEFLAQQIVIEELAKRDGKLDRLRSISSVYALAIVAKDRIDVGESRKKIIGLIDDVAKSLDEVLAKIEGWISPGSGFGSHQQGNLCSKEEYDKLRCLIGDSFKRSVYLNDQKETIVFTDILRDKRGLLLSFKIPRLSTKTFICNDGDYATGCHYKDAANKTEHSIGLGGNFVFSNLKTTRNLRGTFGVKYFYSSSLGEPSKSTEFKIRPGLYKNEKNENCFFEVSIFPNSSSTIGVIGVDLSCEGHKSFNKFTRELDSKSTGWRQDDKVKFTLLHGDDRGAYKMAVTVTTDGALMFNADRSAYGLLSYASYKTFRLEED